MRRPVPLAVALVATLAAAGPGPFAVEARAQSPGADSAVYIFEPRAAYNTGCYGPCDCAIRSQRLSGAFILKKLGVDPLYTNYAVQDLHATFTQEGHTVEVRGHGTYRIGGEFALTHQLKLDLVIGDYAQSFDSGMIPGGSKFPALDLSAAAHGFACVDTVIDFVGAPATAGVPWAARPIDLQVWPNPFASGVSVSLSLAAPAVVDVAIFDLQGRETSALARGLRLGAGEHALAWDGRTSEGLRAPSSVYFVRARAAGIDRVLRIIRID